MDVTQRCLFTLFGARMTRIRIQDLREPVTGKVESLPTHWLLEYMQYPNVASTLVTALGGELSDGIKSIIRDILTVGMMRGLDHDTPCRAKAAVDDGMMDRNETIRYVCASIMFDYKQSEANRKYREARASVRQQSSV